MTSTRILESCWSNGFPLAYIASSLGRQNSQILLMYLYYPPQSCFEMIKHMARNHKFFLLPKLDAHHILLLFQTLHTALTFVSEEKKS